VEAEDVDVEVEIKVGREEGERGVNWNVDVE
jgi:hypothetical protein